MGVAAKIAALERRLGVVAASAPCSFCGGPRNWRDLDFKPGRYEINVVRDVEPQGPEVCPECGRRLIMKVEFDRGG